MTTGPEHSPAQPAPSADTSSGRGAEFSSSQEGHALRYAATIDLNEQNTSQTQMILLTGRDRKVLEVGPAMGDMTRVLSERGCRVTGLEIDPVAARIAEQFCERMIVGNIEQMDLDEVFGEERFDVILFSDVLEHLVDPAAVLAKVRGLLAEGGTVCASIPNVAHGSVRLKLLEGEFRYREKGLLDSTHLRFFDRAGVEEMFAAAGYAVTEWRHIDVGIFANEFELREQDYPHELIEAINASPDSLTYQFVLKAEPAPEGSLKPVVRPTEQPASARKMLEPLWQADLRAWELKEQTHRLQGKLQERDAELDGAKRAIGLLEGRLAGLQHAHDMVVNRINYRLWMKVVGYIDAIAPWGTRRRRLILLPGYALRILLDKGPKGFLLHMVRVWQWAPGLLRRAMDPSAAPAQHRYKVWEDLYVLSPELVKAMKRKLKTFDYKPQISIVLPVYNPEPEWLRAAIDSVTGQIYSKWELCIADDGSTRQDVKDTLKEYEGSDPRIKITYLPANKGITAASQAALDLATGEFVGFLGHDDELKPHALYQVIKLLNERRDLDFIYSDLDHKDLDGILRDPFRKPDWSPDFLKSCNYVTHFSVFRKAVLDKVGGFREGYDGSQDWDLTLRVTEVTDRIGHVRTPLYTWRQVPNSIAHSDATKPWAHDAARRALADALARQGVKGRVEDGPYAGYYRIRYEIQGEPKVSIIIPTRDRADLLKTCIDSIRRLSTYRNYEIVVVDNDSSDPVALDYLNTFGGRVIRHPGEFNFSKIINFAAEHVDGEYLLLLNNDTEVITPDWIEAMLEHAQRPEVGAVGARLLFPDGRAQHEGVIVGPGDGLAGNIDFEGYFGIGRCIHNASAVTAACMMTRAEVFKGLGGFDEDLVVAYNDVDYCLRAGDKGFLILYTPYAVLRHDEAATRGYGDDNTGKSHPVADEEFFRTRWKGYIDPFDPPSLKIDLPPVPSI
ncbi:MAG TPA: glycosyltransferase [Actinomycetota bacterium]|nr:glycosyltransferase [Actinomycetota bacterium]